MWVGTIGYGVYQLMNIDSDFNCVAKTFTTKDGMSNNTARGIIEDRHKHIWVSTILGINRIDALTHSIKTLNRSNGLQDDEFRDLACTKMSSGQLVFGGLNGLSVFDPDEIKEDTITPNVVITEFQLDNRIVNVGDSIKGRVLVEERVENGSHITLDYRQNSFSFYFTSLHYKNSENSKYMHMLEGYDTEWIKTTSLDRVAKYTNLPPGNYVFNVKASNCDATWSDIARIYIHITPPIWDTWYAYLLYLILFVLSIVFVVKTIVKRQKRKHAVAMAGVEKKYLHKLYQAKLDFFTNISHELRTPLTLIISPAQRLCSSTNLDDETKHELTTVILNNRVLLELV